MIDFKGAKLHPSYGLILLFGEAFKQVNIKDLGELIPIMSYNAYNLNTGR